jgi:hypothetical protein
MTMRLILRYEHSDGYTYSCTNTHPVEYDSAEALLVDFMDAAKAALLGEGSFHFLGEEFYADSFYTAVDEDYRRRLSNATYVRREKQWFLEHAPAILTLDEFFADAMRAPTPTKE